MTTPDRLPDDVLVFNGVDGRTGQYLVPPMRVEKLVDVVLGERQFAGRDSIAVKKDKLLQQGTFELLASLSPKKLDQAGWGVIFPASLRPATLAGLKDALGELLKHRQNKAGAFYKEYSGEDGYQKDETAQDWLSRHNASFGRVDPREGDPPYYMLIVGDPNTIPFEFQYNLDVDRAIGRIYFDTLDEFASYARSVVAAETGQVARARQAVFFGVRNPGDRATDLSLNNLVLPLMDRFTKGKQSDIEREKQVLEPWQFQCISEDDATHSRLGQLLGGPETPALMFTASHGLGFRRGDPEQLACQGALVCQEWGGPFGGGIQRGHYFTAEDVTDSANPFGMMAFHFACYGGGTPYKDEFYERYNKTQGTIAPYAFLAKLPRRLLSHPRGGALAVVAHVERAWTHSFKWETSKGQTNDFYEVLFQLMDGYPIGFAMESINTRYASIAAQLTTKLEKNAHTPQPIEQLADLWTGNKDARDYSIIGDPAAQLPLANKPEEIKTDKPIEVVTPRHVTLPPVLDPATDPRATEEVTQDGAAAAGATGGASMIVRRTPSTLENEAFEVNAETVKNIAGTVSSIFDKLAQGFQTITDLEVRTYTSDNISGASFPVGDQGAQGMVPRAMTRVRLNGNTDLVVPTKADESLDNALWKVHKETVAQAWQSRAELLRVLADIIASFRPKLG